MTQQWRSHVKSLIITINLFVTMDLVMTEVYLNYESSLCFCAYVPF